QAEHGAAVIHQVEFDIATAAQQLELALALAVGGGLAALDNGQVGAEERVAHRLHEPRTAAETAVAEVVVEQPADAARFVAMLEKEILVAPAFVTRVDLWTEWIADRPGGAVPVHAILVEAVVRGQIIAAAEPPLRFHSRFFGDEEPHIGMAGRCIGIARMNHQRYPERLPRSADQFGAVRGGGGWKLSAEDMRKADAGLFEYAAFSQHARAAATPARTLP